MRSDATSVTIVTLPDQRPEVFSVPNMPQILRWPSKRRGVSPHTEVARLQSLPVSRRQSQAALAA
jgi:hypothetical protein